MSIEKLTCNVSTTTDLINTVNGLVDFNSAKKSAAGLLNSKLINNGGNAVILVNSDSTGNGSDEFVYLLAQYYAEKYPMYSVNYYIWNDAASGYDPVESISVGTSTNYLSIYNAAISGSKPDYILGEYFDAAVRSVPQADLYILNHGHNLLSQYPDTDPQNRITNLFLNNIMSVLSYHARAGCALVAQNPQRDNNDYERMYLAIKDAAALVGVDCADVYSEFIAAGKSSALYADNIHPSSAGSELFLKAILTSLSGLQHSVPLNSIVDITSNLVVNGNFAAFDSSIPDGFVGTNATVTKDTVNIDGANGYSVKVSPTNTASLSYIDCTLNSSVLNRIKGKVVTLAVRRFIGNSEPNTAGRFALLTTSQVTNTYTISASGKGGWQWAFISVYVRQTDSYCRVRLYGDTGGTGGTCSFDRVMLTTGRLPKDCFI